MSVGVGLGLALNVLFWTLAVLVVTGLASLAAIEYFPGRERKGNAEPRVSAGGREAAEPHGEEDESPERYRKAS